MARSGTEGRGVLEGAFALMEVLAQGDEVGLTRLAADAELPKATAHRLLGQLVALGAVQSVSGRYRLGPRTFRLGQDTLLVAGDGKSSISFADFAIAMADEIEAPKHSRSRFTVGY